MADPLDLPDMLRRSGIEYHGQAADRLEALQAALAEACDAFVECTGPYALELAGADLLRWRALANPLFATDVHCPDGGACHHECVAQGVREGLPALCWRTVFAEPLSAAGYPGDRWPTDEGMAPVPGAPQ